MSFSTEGLELLFGFVVEEEDVRLVLLSFLVGVGLGLREVAFLIRAAMEDIVDVDRSSSVPCCWWHFSGQCFVLCL